MTRLAVAVACVAAQAETLRYRAEWKGLEAGEAVLSWEGSGARLELRSKGVLAKLRRIDDAYSVTMREGFCAESSLMVAHEGSRRYEVRVGYGPLVSVLTRDLVRGREALRDFPGAPCVHEVLGALRRLISERVEPGSAVEYPMANERKAARVRVVGLRKEWVSTPAGRFESVAYEAHLLNDVLYRRSGRLLVWVSADPGRLPVRVQVRMPFPVGAATLDLVGVSR